jgi:hypothetical protein
VLSSLEGWGEDMRARGQDRLQELRSAWVLQAGRVREMDRIIERARNLPPDGELLSGSERIRGSQEAIRQNLERLGQVRQQTLDELLGLLARVRELVSMIHLARFTSAPAARAEELVAQLGTLTSARQEHRETQKERAAGFIPAVCGSLRRPPG